MREHTQSNYEALKKLGIFKPSATELSQSTISRLVAQGSLIKVAPGLFIHPESNIPPEKMDFAVACARYGKSVAIGGLTALFHYNLVEQVPNQIWLISNHQINCRNTDNFYRCLTTKSSLDFGITEEKYFRITNLERTLIESMKFGSKIGKISVIGATRTALQENRTSVKKLNTMAKKLELRSTLLKYWEAVIA